MSQKFDPYISDYSWIIIENGWDPLLQGARESQFTLGNGYICSRGILEELPQGSDPGTFFAGLFESTGAQVTELINAPNPIDFNIMVRGERLGVGTMDVLEHKRFLDMRAGTLNRHTVYSSSRKKRFDYKSQRFFSMHNKNIAVMRVSVTPIDEDAVFSIESSVDTSVTNKGLITEGDKKHFHITDVAKKGKIDYLCVKTLEKETYIAFASQLKIKKGKRGYFAPRRATYNLKIKKGQTLHLTKFFSFCTSLEATPATIKKKTINILNKAVPKSFRGLIDEHRKAWLYRWEMADIDIKNRVDILRALRFNLYHLLIASDKHTKDVSIGAKTLSGEGYRGHVFWDTEIFILPFFVYTDPELAKNFLMYRINRLNSARANAKLNSYKGAMFPWESADTGEEATPAWYKKRDGSIGKVETGKLEHHITADISYAVVLYYDATRDDIFMLEHGFELLCETARFWASRVEYNKKKKYYEIKNVIGPDEFHENVNNNAFTNYMAGWNLKKAAQLYKEFSARYKRTVDNLKKKLILTDNEVSAWEKIGEQIYFPVSKTGIIEQFEGFFDLEKCPSPPRQGEYSMPGDSIKTQSEHLQKTQFVKQSDVLMLLYLFPEEFTYSETRKNYLFYERRTLHRSSLSVCVHSIISNEISEHDDTEMYFHVSLLADLKNIYNNTDHGIHAASLGGAWQIFVHGFAGLRFVGDSIICNPRLPKFLPGMSFQVIWRGYKIRFTITDKTIQFYAVSAYRTKQIRIKVFDKEHKVPVNETVLVSLNNKNK
ncbi:MAG: glycosyl hydrolase family 65 protein [Elusimicrobiota bacterium]